MINTRICTLSWGGRDSEWDRDPPPPEAPGQLAKALHSDPREGHERSPSHDPLKDTFALWGVLCLRHVSRV